jgi:hypothetical protein
VVVVGRDRSIDRSTLVGRSVGRSVDRGWFSRRRSNPMARRFHNTVERNADLPDDGTCQKILKLLQQSFYKC